MRVRHASSYEGGSILSSMVVCLQRVSRVSKDGRKDAVRSSQRSSLAVGYVYYENITRRCRCAFSSDIHSKGA